MAAFQSTLTEAREANVLLHVIDASDPRREEHIDEVNRVLAQIGADAIPQIRVYNKIDRLELQPRVEQDAEGNPDAVWISAGEGQGLDLLQQTIAERLSCAVRRLRLRLPLTAGAARAKLYGSGVVVSERRSEEGFDLTVDLPPAEQAVLERLAGARIEAA